MKITTQAPGENAVPRPDAESATKRVVGIPRAQIAANRRGSRLALGKDRLYQLGSAELVVWDAAAFTVMGRHPCPAPRGILSLPDGGAIALCGSDQPGYTAVMHVPPGAGTPQVDKIFLSCHPSEFSRLFVRNGGKRFAIVSLNGKTAVDEVELSDERGAVRKQRFELTHDAFYTLTPLGDGVWLYDNGLLMRREGASEQSLHYTAEVQRVVHIVSPAASAAPIAALADGSVVRLKISGTSVEATPITQASGKMPFLLHAAADKIAVAFVSSSYEAELVVVNDAGRELLRAQLPWQLSLTDAEQHSLRVNDTRVVLGDGQRLAAWDLESRERIIPKS